MMTDSSGSNGKYRIMAEINMIPLIDVALVLLIIFMVMTPILVKSQIKLNLPSAASGEKSSTEKTLEIQIAKGGILYIQGRPIADTALAGEIKIALDHKEFKTLAIEADKDVPFEHVVKVMDTARKAGVQKISVGVKPVSAR